MTIDDTQNMKVKSLSWVAIKNKGQPIYNCTLQALNKGSTLIIYIRKVNALQKRKWKQHWVYSYLSWGQFKGNKGCVFSLFPVVPLTCIEIIYNAIIKVMNLWPNWITSNTKSSVSGPLTHRAHTHRSSYPILVLTFKINIVYIATTCSKWVKKKKKTGFI